MLSEWVGGAIIDGKWNARLAWKARLSKQALLVRCPPEYTGLDFLFDAVPDLRQLTVQDPNQDLHRIESAGGLEALDLLGARPSRPLDGSALYKLTSLTITTAKNMRGLLNAPHLRQLVLHGWSKEIRLPSNLSQVVFVGIPHLPNDPMLQHIETLEMHGGRVVDLDEVQQRCPRLKNLDLFNVQSVINTNSLGTFDRLERLTLWEPDAVDSLEGLRSVNAKRIFLSGKLFSRGPGRELRRELAGN